MDVYIIKVYVYFISIELRNQPIYSVNVMPFWKDSRESSAFKVTSTVLLLLLVHGKSGAKL